MRMLACCLQDGMVSLVIAACDCVVCEVEDDILLKVENIFLELSL